MAEPWTVPVIRRIVKRLRAEGVTVVEIPGWQSRGSGDFARIDCQLNHHDAFPARTGHAGGLRTCTFGRSDLRNSLCMFYLGSDGTVYVVAARVSWHAGKGDLTTNSRASGIEARNDGVGERWPPRQLEVNRRLNIATSDAFGFSKARIFDHKEHSSTGKVDRFGIDPRMWRASLMSGSPGTQPKPTPRPEEFLMALSDTEQRELLAKVRNIDTKATAIDFRSAQMQGEVFAGVHKPGDPSMLRKILDAVRR